jgi:histone-lysine N-methyltransferase SETD3
VIDTIDRLMAWARAAGAYVDPIEIRVDERGSRGLFAARAVRAGEILIRVPRTLVVTHDVMAETPAGGSVASIAGMLHSRYEIHAVWLASERADPRSAWRPFLDAMPASFPSLPASRTTDELVALEGTRALALVRQRAEELHRDLTIVSDLVDEARELSREALVWGHQAASTRGFRTDDDARPALVPIADMANHGEACASFSFAANGDFEVHARRDLDAGREIYTDYGRNSNARWLAGYGFALPDNPEDEIALSFSPDSSPVFVGAVADDRFRIAALLAGNAEEIVAAARRADHLISRTPPQGDGDAGWQRTCEIVRAGERAVLAQIIERADELFAACAGGA